MKICIFGAGAIGGLVGLKLQRGGADVSLIARGTHLDAIKTNGLTIHSEAGTAIEQMTATDNPADLGPQDYVIIALKAHQAWYAAEQIASLCSPDTAVVTLQNGIPWWYFYKLGEPFENHRLATVDPQNRQWNAIGPQRAIGATVYPAGEIVEPGVIKHIFGEKIGLGEPNRETTSRVQALAEILSAGGLEPIIYPDIRDDIWLKLWGNLCFNPISTLTRATLEDVATDPGTRGIAVQMMAEAREIGERLGVQFRISIDQRIRNAASVGAHRTSMLQDLEKDRSIELDAILSSVQEMARLVEVETPMIDAILSLTKQMGRVAGLYPAYPEGS